MAIEERYQKQWEDAKIFEVDAPSTSEIPYGAISQDELHKKYPKFFGTSAYAYMNGILHMGHSFTISKLEFTAGFQRMKGKRVLFPWGYHCTGLPIKACADKLIEEVKMFGEDFSGYKADEDAPEEPPAPTQDTSKDDVTKFTAKKGKLNAKTVKAKYQFQIMLSQGIPKNQLSKFSDPQYWLEYYPPLCKRDMSSIGMRVDWRRQFVTTDANPYYDAFIRWQMNRLHEMEKIRFGSRYTIYSPKDGQPCMDHDRSKGEAILPQEYTALKLRVKEFSPKLAELVKDKIPSTADVFFVPATLRPETMYGQVCCFVGPNITYGVFKVSDNEYYVFTKRAAWNLAFQGPFFDREHFPRHQSALPPVFEFPGSSAIGTLVEAPLSVHPEVRILPMDTVLAAKGTGVVTSVPSDSPDDFATMRDLAKKAEYYGIQKDWAELEIKPIINTPSYGDLCAKYLVEKMKISSPKDTKQLAEAKDLAYKEGYYKGKMLIGEYKGETVESAKPKVREDLIRAGKAFAYAEPAGQVVSRSGDECVVAYLGQWFLNYGDQDVEWRDQVSEHVHSKNMELYSSETLHGFEGVLDWLNKWACARTYGLGSRLPWDSKFLVESLSDSTIYMAYYTIVHYLHSDLFGKQPGRFHIKPEQLTDEAWDCIFTRRPIDDAIVKETSISKEQFETLRREFEYWYPLDFRGSGKDLIPNHLTFFLYIHVAMFPPRLWPRSVRVNGHAMLNGEKMSKSTGNFLTLREAVDKFGADATRIALADAGDGVEDANLDENVANSNILRLYTLKEWCEEVSKDRNLRTDTKDLFFDKLFVNEMSEIVRQAYQHYDATNYKLALKSSLFDFTSARDFYREATIAAGIGMRKDLVLRYIELQALLLAPIAPHWCDYIWQELLHKVS
jgi:leucyl-tRNA synthetase